VGLLTGEVATSLISYILVYSVVFTAGALFILRLMAEGPVAGAAEPAPAGEPGRRVPP
jgi:cytochrome d ubiquinol oxidase subunit I